MPMPSIDCHAAAQLRNALVGGVWADAPERRAAARLEAAVPGIRRLYLRARKFHARAARWAVTEAAMAGVVYLAAGFPADPMPHLDLVTGAVLPGQHVYADDNSDAAAVTRALTGDAPNVTSVKACATDPGAVLTAPEIRSIDGPLQVQLQLVLPYCTPACAAGIFADYGRLLPPGSVMVVTWIIPDGSPPAVTWAQVVGDLAGRVHGHAPADVLQWLDDAGFRVSRPATDVRVAGLQSWAVPYLPEDVSLRVMQAAGRKPG